MMHFSRPLELNATILLLSLSVLLAAGLPVMAEEHVPVQEMPREAAPVPAQREGSNAEGARETRPDRDLRKMSLEELMDIEVQTVVSASRYRQKVSEAPASVTIITTRDIQKYGYRTLADILKSVRGFYITYDRNYQYLGVRGFGRPGDYNTRILLLVDGHRLNDAIYDAAAIGTDFILDVDLIERVEVTRGPGSSLYGSNAFFAVVNVITRRAKDIGGVELSAEGGSHGTYKGRLSYGGAEKNGPGVLLSASGFTSAGDNLYFPEYDPGNPLADPRAANGGYADNGDYDRYGSAYAKYEVGGLQLAAAYIERTKGVPTASYGTDFNNPGNRTTDGRGYVDLQYGTRLAGGVELSIRTYYDWYGYDADYLYTGIVNKDRSNAEWYGGDVRVTARLLNAHRIIAGTEYEVRQRQDQYNADGAPPVIYLDDQRSSSTWAVYAQDEITVSPVFLLYAGLRYDRISTFGGMTNPRVAAVIKPIENGTLKLLYGKAFRAPNVYELYYATPPSVLSNSALQPERIETYELVYEHDLGNGLRASVSRYSYSIRNLITQTYDPASGTTSFQNQERAEAEGTELEVQKSWLNGADARLSYVFQKAVDPNTGELLSNAPKQLAKLNLVVPIIKERFFAGIEEQYTSSRNTVGAQRIEGFGVTNMTLFGRGPQRKVEASLSIYNVLNKRYADPVSSDLFPIDSVQQDGRTIRVKLTYVF
jgi:outer membrane receptor for ferrienterochelin and colicin